MSTNQPLRRRRQQRPPRHAQHVSPAVSQTALVAPNIAESNKVLCHTLLQIRQLATKMSSLTEKVVATLSEEIRR
ncbi:MAG TPA: hypothetical protein VGH68_17685, partial [Paraburkholderia sp.]